MKATGIIRKIDDLGRIVIPKEMRKTLRIREGDSLEIYVERNGEIVLKRYAPLGEIIDEINIYAEVLYKSTGFNVCITDNKEVIAISGATKRKYIDSKLSDELIYILEMRELYINKKDRSVKITQKDDIAYSTQIIAPIISDADLIGSIIFFSDEVKKTISEVDLAQIKTAVNFLAKQME